jgi:hypothetical protein
VGPSGAAAHPHVGERDDVQREVELSVAASRQSVPCSVCAGDLKGATPA